MKAHSRLYRFIHWLGSLLLTDCQAILLHDRLISCFYFCLFQFEDYNKGVSKKAYENVIILKELQVKFILSGKIVI